MQGLIWVIWGDLGVKWLSKFHPLCLRQMISGLSLLGHPRSLLKSCKLGRKPQCLCEKCQERQCSPIFLGQLQPFLQSASFNWKSWQGAKNWEGDFWENGSTKVLLIIHMSLSPPVSSQLLSKQLAAMKPTAPNSVHPSFLSLCLLIVLSR